MVLNVPKVTFHRVVRNLYSVKLILRLIWQVSGLRNIDVLQVFFERPFLNSRGDSSGKCMYSKKEKSS